MAYAYPTGPGTWAEITGDFRIEGQGYPANWPDLVGEAARSAVGVREIVEPTDPIPDGQVVTAAVVQQVAGVLTRLRTFGTKPLPATVPMYKVKKFMVLHKAQTGIDLDAAVGAFLEALPEPNRSLALVDWTRSPNLVVNSPLALGAKAALSLSDEQYAAMVRAADEMA